MTEKQGFATKSIHAHQEPNPIHGAVMPGIEMSTIYAQPSPDRKYSSYSYSRSNNPTRDTMEKLIASTEGGKYGISFGSGSAAIIGILSSLAANKNIICGQDVWGGTNRIMTLAKTVNNINTKYIDLSGQNGVDALKKLLSQNPTTKYELIWLESPTNPALKVSDIKALCDIARANGMISVIDNTFATPYNTLPLNLGCDIVMHSATKYLNGHSDVVMGIAVTNCDILHKKIRYMQNTYGAVKDAFACYLVIRSMKTLDIRMERHALNAMKVAQFLESHPKVEKVNYPFLASNPNCNLAKRQMKTGGGMVSFLLKGGLRESKQFLENLKVWTLTASLGCPESLACHPAIMTHDNLSPQERKEQGILDNFIRLSVGLEDYRDLINGLKYGLNAVTSSSRLFLAQTLQIMSDVKNTIGMLFVGIINVLSCYVAAFITYRFGKRLNVSSSIPWCLLQISYGTMPFFGLWDNLVRISKYDNRDMNGFSSFFSVMTLMFLGSATIIDSKLGNIQWNIKHILIYLFIIIPFWLILFLVEELDKIAYSIYPLCMLPIALPCTILIIYHLRKLSILYGIAGFILFSSLIFSVLGFMSLIIFERENPLRMYGWYIFCWLSVILLFVLWSFIHIYKRLDNGNDKSLTDQDTIQDVDL